MSEIVTEAVELFNLPKGVLYNYAIFVDEAVIVPFCLIEISAFVWADEPLVLISFVAKTKDVC